MASALFTIDGNALSAGIVTVSASASVALAVVDTSGVSSIEWSCVGTHSSSVATATITAAITPAGSLPGATATLAMPAGAGQSYLIRCLVRDGQGRVTDYKQGQVAVLNNNSILPLAFGETFERNITHGWIDPINTFLNTAPGGALLTTGGTMSGDIAMGTNNITGVGYIALGTGTLPSAGEIRLTDGSSIDWRVGSNDVSLLAAATNEFIVGNYTNLTDLDIRATTSITIGVGGATDLQITGSLIDAQSNPITTTGAITGASFTGTTYVTVGTNPAAAGTYRCEHTTNGFAIRDNANSADVTVFGISAGDALQVGDTTDAAGIDYLAKTGTEHSFKIAGTDAFVVGGAATRVRNALSTDQGSELTIASGVITATHSYHTVDTESDAASDDLVTINGGSVSGQRLTIRAADSARTVVAKDGSGNLTLAGDFSMDNAEDTLELIYDQTGTQWLETSRSNNGA